MTSNKVFIKIKIEMELKQIEINVCAWQTLFSLISEHEQSDRNQDTIKDSNVLQVLFLPRLTSKEQRLKIDV